MYLLKIVIKAMMVTSFCSAFEFMSNDHLKLALGNPDNEWNLFERFREDFGKAYDNFDEMRDRFNVFRQNLRTIVTHNNENRNFTLGVNRFTDLTNEEYSDKYLGGFVNKEFWPKHCSIYKSKYTYSDLPKSVDWTNILGPILNQEQCGSCYAFSAVQQIQSSYTQKYGKLIDLSEEQVVECSKKNNGCGGGLMTSVDEYAMSNPLCLEEDYPYTSGNGRAGNCQTSCEGIVTVESCYEIEENNQQQLKDAVYGQPVSVAIDASTPYFQMYSGGIIDSDKCGTDLDHAVFLIGYGTENEIDYWLLRNSWGESWGDNGTFKILRSNSTDDMGICGIAGMTSFAIVK